MLDLVLVAWLIGIIPFWIVWILYWGRQANRKLTDHWYCSYMVSLAVVAAPFWPISLVCVVASPAINWLIDSDFKLLVLSQKIDTWWATRDRNPWW